MSDIISKRANRSIVEYGVNGYSKDINGVYFGVLYDNKKHKRTQSKSEKIESIQQQIIRLNFIQNELKLFKHDTSYKTLLTNYKIMLSELTYYDEDDSIYYTKEGRAVHNRQRAYMQDVKPKVEQAVFNSIYLKDCRLKMSESKNFEEYKYYKRLHDSYYLESVQKALGKVVTLEGMKDNDYNLELFNKDKFKVV